MKKFIALVLTAIMAVALFGCGQQNQTQAPSIPFNWYIDAINEIGADHIVIGSDCGQARKTYPPETIRMFAQTLNYQGISASDIHKMLVTNYDPLLD